MRLGLLVGFLLATLVVVAPAHAATNAKETADIPGVWWICKAVGQCSNPPPRPGPEQDCHIGISGKLMKVWDARLGAYVLWRCMCDSDGVCKWFRVRIVPNDALPWDPPKRRHVIDARRACKSIVCKKVWVGVWYPSRWVFG